MAFDPPLLETALNALGRTLARRGVPYEIVAAGGSGLLLLGLTTRSARDLDVLALVEGGRYVTAAPLPPCLAEAAKDVAALYGLADDWLNPTSSTTIR